jgi:HSP20 family protein
MHKKKTRAQPSDNPFIPIPSHFLSTSSMDSVRQGHFWKPPTDVYETEDELIIRAEIAGMEIKDFSIQVKNQFLIIQGKRNIEFEKCALHQIEILSGEFQICIGVSSLISKSVSKISYDNGFLIISFPKYKRKN